MDDKSESPASYWSRLMVWGMYFVFMILAIVINALLMRYLGSNTPTVPSPPPPIIVVSPDGPDVKLTIIYTR